MTTVDGRVAPEDGERWHWEEDGRPVRPTPDADAPRVVRRRRSAGIPPLGHQPALDGLRAVAVMAVLVYHAKFEWAQGGFLGVSAFFTLSGFLITSLLLREGIGSEAVDLRRFWRRRFRRLLPASWTTLGLVLLMGLLGLWTTDQLRDLRADVPFSLAEIVNWHFIAADRTYGANFVAPSPVEHFWSLSVEQQFYVVLPVLLIGGLALGRRRRGGSRVMPLVWILAVVGIASAVANGLLARSSIDRAYFGTDTRLAEMVVGALLACALLRGTTLRSDAARRLWRALAVAGLLVSIWLWHVATVESTWMYPWGFLLTAGATGAMILGALQGGGLGAVLAWRPLVWLGGISYGIYLLHWPIFLWLTPARTGWAPWPLFALRMAVTLTAAIVMYRLIEQPVRSGTFLRPPKGVAVAGIAVVALIALDGVTTRDLPPPSALERAEAGATAKVPVAAPLKVLVVGDELAASLQPAPGDRPVKGLDLQVAAAPSCGLSMGGWVQLPDGRVERDPDRCGSVRDTWVAAATAERPDVVLVWGGLRDVANRRLGLEDQRWQTSTDPAITDFLRSDVGDLVDSLSSTGSKVVLLSTPHLRNTTLPGPSPALALPPDARRAALERYREEQTEKGAPSPSHTENDDLRIDRWNQVLQGVAAANGAGFVDVAAQLRAHPGGEFAPDVRAAGVGLTAAGRTDVLGWLRPQLKQLSGGAAPAGTAPVAAEAPLPPAPAVTPRRTTRAGQPAQVMVVGDSVSYNFAYGLQLWGKGRKDLTTFNAAQLGCPVARGGDFRFLRNFNVFPDRCDWANTFPQWIRERSPNVVVLASGIWEVVDRRLPGDDRWRHIGQPQVDDYVLREFLTAIDTLGAKGATVVLVTYPHFEAGADQGFTNLPESQPARVDRLNELLRQAASLRPGVAAVVDFQSWLAAQPGGEADPEKRVDGLHFRDSYVPTIGAWMGPQLVALARTGPPPPAPAPGQ